jgi:hypothetical protein
VDIGAVEAISVVVANTNNNGVGSLSAALASGADNVTFTDSLSGKIIRGGFVISKSLAIDASILSGGIILDGRGVFRILTVDSGTFVTLNFLTFTNGYDSYSGGGIYTRATLTLNNCSFLNNRAEGYGGAIGKVGGSLRLNNCTLVGNSANQQGGALFDQAGPTTLNHCTVVSNSAPSLGGIGFTPPDATMSLTNTIVAGNNALAFPDIAGLFAGTNNLIGGDPLLAPMGDYGGPTWTMPPLAGSPAIDMGAPTSLSTDQRGLPRALDGDGNGSPVADIGAVEYFVPASPGLRVGLSRLGNGSGRLSFTNLSGLPSYVLASTNVAAPRNTWLNLGATVETPPGSGQYQFTDPEATNRPGRFYILRVP